MEILTYIGGGLGACVLLYAAFRLISAAVYQSKIDYENRRAHGTKQQK